MTEKQANAYNKLLEIDRKITMVGHISAVLGYDFETVISKKGGEERAQQLAFLSSMIHDMVTDKEIGNCLEVLAGVSDATDEQKALVRVWNKEYTNATKIPGTLVSKITKAANECQNRWFQARQDADFDSFYPYLERLVDLNKEEAQILSNGRSLYDTMLDQNETGFDSSQISALFDGMQKTINDVLKQVESSNNQLSEQEQAFLYQKYDKEKQQKFSRLILQDMGFDFDRGSIGQVVHPFTSTVGSDDIRITTNFESPNVTSQLYTIVHEGGHALYEMGANSGTIKGTTLGQGESNTFHESQSRLWENLVARSPQFWEHYFPIFKDIFPDQTRGVDLSTMLKAINRVKCDDVRVNADEVTYGLHIILRFRLEKSFIDGDLKIKDLPDAWNAMSLELLGKYPDSIKSGVLQDVHWMGGMYGYFPSYALGNLINAHIWHYMSQDLDLNNILKRGELVKIKDYLTEKYYRFGCIYPSANLLQRVTGKTLDASYFDTYLKEKYRRLFG